MFSVYDGHGKYGDQVSREAMHTIYRMLEDTGDDLLDDPAGMLADAFEATNIHLRLMACEPDIQVNALDSGTCAVVALLYHRELYASVGDCRCVLGGRRGGRRGGGAGAGAGAGAARSPTAASPARARADADELFSVRLSTDHKVDLPGEAFGAAGCAVAHRQGRRRAVPARMYEVEGKPWLGPACPRALGDLNALRCDFIPTPEIFTHEVRPRTASSSSRPTASGSLSTTTRRRASSTAAWPRG